MDISRALGRDIPFATHLGIQLLEHGEGRSVLTLQVLPEFTNRFDIAHGGAVMTLLDVAMAVAAHSLAKEASGVITVEMKSNFIGGARGRIKAAGRCLHLGKTLAFCDAEAHGEDGKLVATASGTFMAWHGARPGRPGDGKAKS